MTDALRKAAEMALEVMSKEPESFTLWVEDMRQAREALRQALTQPEQKPVAWINNDYEVFFDAGKAACYSMGWIKPLYTAPPKREWVGLTDEQIYEHEWWHEETAFAVNKELKEKNT